MGVTPGFDSISRNEQGASPQEHSRSASLAGRLRLALLALLAGKLGDWVANKRILIVEDERVVAEQLQQMLAANGYEIVGIVGSGEEAVDHGQDSRPDLVVMDIVLSGNLDGISAASNCSRSESLSFT